MRCGVNTQKFWMAHAKTTQILLMHLHSSTGLVMLSGSIVDLTDKETGRPVNHPVSRVRHGTVREVLTVWAVFTTDVLTPADPMAGHLTYTCQSLQTLLGVFYPGSYIPWIPPARSEAAGESANRLVSRALSKKYIKIRCPGYMASEDFP